MKLYLVRHGQAYPSSENPDRPLTEEGKKNALKTGEYLKKNNIKPEEIITSTKARAYQTGEIIAEIILPDKKVQKRDGIKPDDPIENILIEIESETKDIMIVGHLPFLQKLASKLLVGNELKLMLDFDNVTVLSLRQYSRGSWTIDFFISPAMI